MPKHFQARGNTPMTNDPCAEATALAGSRSCLHGESSLAMHSLIRVNLEKTDAAAFPHITIISRAMRSTTFIIAADESMVNTLRLGFSLRSLPFWQTLPRCTYRCFILPRLVAIRLSGQKTPTCTPERSFQGRESINAGMTIHQLFSELGLFFERSS